jgi:hypothetical protein
MMPNEMKDGAAAWVYESDVPPEEGAAIKVVEATDDARTEDVIVMAIDSETNTLTVRQAGSES